MNKGTQEFLAKAVVLGILTFIILLAFYMQDMRNYLFFAVSNTVQLGVVGLIFIGLSWKKLQNLPQFKLNLPQSAALAVFAGIMLGTRYVGINLPYRTVLSVLGLITLGLAVYGLDTVKVILKDYQKEVAITVVAGIVLKVILIVTNLQNIIRGFF